MNERIRELAEQALQLVADEHTDGDESRLNTDSYHVKDLIQEKFAELIVLECMNQIQEVKDIKAGNAGKVYTQGFDDGMFVAIRTIEEHFGVEE
jgi:hypothetical protein